MKSFVLILLFSILVFQFPAYAQMAPTPEVVSLDSLQHLVNTHPKEDTVRVNLLNTLARFCFYDLQYKRGIINTKEARKVAQKINYRRGEGLYLRALSVMNSGTPLSFYFEIQTRWFYERIGEKEIVKRMILNDLVPVNWNKAGAELFAALNYAEQQQDVELTAMLCQIIREMYSRTKEYDKSLIYADRALQLFQKINHPNLEFCLLTSKMRTLNRIQKVKEAKAVETQLVRTLVQQKDVRDKALLSHLLGTIYSTQNQQALGLEYLFKANALLEQSGETQFAPEVLISIGYAFNALTMYKKSAAYYAKAIPLLDHIKNYPLSAIYVFTNLTYLSIKLKNFDEANLYIKQYNEIANKWKYKNEYFDHESRGEILMYQGNPQEAIPHFHLANAVYNKTNKAKNGFDFANLYIGQCYLALGNFKESIAYGELAYAGSSNIMMQELPIKSSLLLSEAYEKAGQPMKAYEYLKRYRAIMKANDEQDLAGRSSMAEIEGIVQKSEQEKAALEREKLIKEAENQNQRWWLITASGILISVFVVLLVLYRNNRQKQLANMLLHRQKEEIDHQRSKVENALTDLKATQTQLIQKEKLASLGELTAGIAHEIQNPLNFVNNFSEVSTDLVEELKQEALAGHTDDVLAIADDLAQNLQKITHHGGRASNIVKGMLEHSRSGSGEKRPTDLNALCDEYLKIAYHGLKAKDNSFNCELVTGFDHDLGKVNVVPQEVGRVLLNLYNNAFYAVKERGALGKGQGLDYQPTVWVSTKLLDNKVEIRVRDNGSGIPESVIDKIFQPFFTTKPTGEGTGLGLSLSYDVVTKGHGGTLTVESEVESTTEFLIRLPIV
ncbi:ATP-binding protein [Dyadobacter sp. NIV53]|uniref:tetratricopeptide repeat-containing sensor histidine kinase n=1 Tax=Dyadobacter sp. NIV53 TaxID=2861765 RepID=UPI001E4DD7E8|nr:ATP-binding protein [Dyadobacter sp. NIV53]